MNDFQIKSSKNKSTNALEVMMMGRLNVTNMLAIQTEFNALIKGNKKVELNILNVDDADISLIQMIEGLKIKYKNSSVDLTVSYNLNTDITELFKKAGLTNLIN